MFIYLPILKLYRMTDKEYKLIILVIAYLFIIPIVVFFVIRPLNALFGVHKDSIAADIIITIGCFLITWILYIIWKKL